MISINFTLKTPPAKREQAEIFCLYPADFKTGRTGISLTDCARKYRRYAKKGMVH
jgi:hypothetical protein